MKKKQFRSFAYLFIFPYLSLILTIMICLDNWNIIRNKDTVIYTYIENAKEGKLGYGFNKGSQNHITFKDLEEGDIILGGNSDCAYGYFSHVGIYAGENQVMEAYADLGVHLQDISHYWDYEKVCLLRVEAEVEKKQKAVAYVKSFEGGLFYPLAFKPGDRLWNCSKIIWKAYYEQGLNLDPANDLWIAPDTFCDSPLLTIITEKGR
jgi:uncharacterized protein YycO